MVFFRKYSEIWIGHESIPSGAEREAFVGLFVAQRMQVAAGAKLHDNARVMGGFELGVKRRQKRMVQHLQNLPLHLSSLHLLLLRQGLFVHHLHRVVVGTVSERAQIHCAYVSGADAADESEVTEGQARPANGGVGEIGGTVRL